MRSHVGHLPIYQAWWVVFPPLTHISLFFFCSLSSNRETISFAVSVSCESLAVNSVGWILMLEVIKNRKINLQVSISEFTDFHKML